MGLWLSCPSSPEVATMTQARDNDHSRLSCGKISDAVTMTFCPVPLRQHGTSDVQMLNSNHWHSQGLAAAG